MSPQAVSEKNRISVKMNKSKNTQEGSYDLKDKYGDYVYFLFIKKNKWF